MQNIFCFFNRNWSRSFLNYANRFSVYDTVGYFGTIFGSILTHNLLVLANEDITVSNAIGAFPTILAPPRYVRRLQ